VIENYDKIDVKLSSGEVFKAELIGADRSIDLALLKIDAKGEKLPTLAFVDSESLRVGEWVIAIGNPPDFDHTVTVGVVSGKERRVPLPQTDEGVVSFIQTDAAINLGNSGGPLIDSRGNVIGINTAIRQNANSVGFAIPVNMARSVMEQIISFGSVRRGLLGVNIATITPEIAESYSLDATSGALVTMVADESAAENAGLQIGDVIVTVDAEPIEGAESLRNAIGLLRPGDSVEVGFIREGSEQTITAILGEANPPADEQQQLGSVDPVFEGAEIVTSDQPGGNSDGVAGLLVTQVQSGSPAALRGLRANDIITHINRQRTRSVSEAIDIIESARSVILQVQRGNRSALVLMR